MPLGYTRKYKGFGLSQVKRLRTARLLGLSWLRDKLGVSDMPKDDLEPAVSLANEIKSSVFHQLSQCLFVHQERSKELKNARLMPLYRVLLLRSTNSETDGNFCSDLSAQPPQTDKPVVADVVPNPIQAYVTEYQYIPADMYTRDFHMNPVDILLGEQDPDQLSALLQNAAQAAQLCEVDNVNEAKYEEGDEEKKEGAVEAEAEAAIAAALAAYREGSVCVDTATAKRSLLMEPIVMPMEIPDLHRPFAGDLVHLSYDALLSLLAMPKDCFSVDELRAELVRAFAAGIQVGAVTDVHIDHWLLRILSMPSSKSGLQACVVVPFVVPVARLATFSLLVDQSVAFWNGAGGNGAQWEQELLTSCVDVLSLAPAPPAPMVDGDCGDQCDFETMAVPLEEDGGKPPRSLCFDKPLLDLLSLTKVVCNEAIAYLDVMAFDLAPPPGNSVDDILSLIKRRACEQSVAADALISYVKSGEGILSPEHMVAVEPTIHTIDDCVSMRGQFDLLWGRTATKDGRWARFQMLCDQVGMSMPVRGDHGVGSGCLQNANSIQNAMSALRCLAYAVDPSDDILKLQDVMKLELASVVQAVPAAAIAGFLIEWLSGGDSIRNKTREIGTTDSDLSYMAASSILWSGATRAPIVRQTVRVWYATNASFASTIRLSIETLRAKMNQTVPEYYFSAAAATV
jgi:hypothetical protein